MNVNNKEKRTKIFNSLYKIFKIRRSSTLIEIYKLSKQFKEDFDRTLISHEYIKFLENKYNFSYKQSSKKVLWIYIKEDKKYNKDAYNKIEKNLIKKVSKNDEFIVIGKKALEFAKQNNYKVIYSFDKVQNDISLHQQLSFITKKFMTNKTFHKIQAVLYSNRIKNYTTSIYPFNEFDFNLNKIENSNTLNLSNESNFYLEVDQFYNSVVEHYLFNFFKSLINESLFISYKTKLIYENQTIKELESEIDKLKKDIIKEKRESEIEELSIIGANSHKGNLFASLKTNKNNEKGDK